LLLTDYFVILATPHLTKRETKFIRSIIVNFYLKNCNSSFVY